jgi:hypothetical protein
VADSRTNSGGFVGKKITDHACIHKNTELFVALALLYFTVRVAAIEEEDS